MATQNISQSQKTYLGQAGEGNQRHNLYCFVTNVGLNEYSPIHLLIISAKALVHDISSLEVNEIILKLMEINEFKNVKK